MASLLALSARKIDWTLDLTFPDASAFHFATAPLTISAVTYTNDLESVREIRQTLESASDKVGFAIQNKDSVLGQHVAANFDLWRKAEAVIGRLYTDREGLGLSEWVPMFRGVVQQPKTEDLQVSSDILTDTLSPGLIVANRNLGLPCPFLYKDPKTCGYTGVLTSCDHGLKSANGCDVHGNSHHYGGMEHRYQNEQTPPGIGGGDEPGGDVPPGHCPRVDQWLKVEGWNGKPIYIPAGKLTTDHFLWDPISRSFEAVEEARLVKNVPIFRIKSSNGVGCYSSTSHLVMPNRNHRKGVPVDRFTPDAEVLTEKRDVLCDSTVTVARPTGRSADVMFIHMAKGHRYCAGEKAGESIVAHNKPIGPLEGGQ